MTRCVNCGKACDDISEVTYWTARETTRVTPYNGSVERQTASRYEDFRAHTYRVCASCRRGVRRRLWVGLGLFIALMVGILLVVGLARWSDTAEYSLIIAGGAAAFGLAMLAAGRWRLPRTALAERLRYDPHGRYQVFTEAQYQRLAAGKRRRMYSWFADDD